MSERRRRIGAIHALHGSITPTDAAFARLWPEAEVSHLLDGSLYLDRSRGTADEAELGRRIAQLIAYSAETGADGVIFTGSFFGDHVAAARETVSVPVARSFDGIVARALALDAPLHVLSTAPDSMRLLTAELAEEAARHTRRCDLSGAAVPDALDALVAGDPARHDRLVLDAALAVPAEAAVVFAQFSMERVLEEAVHRRPTPTIGPATEAVAHLRRALTRS